MRTNRLMAGLGLLLGLLTMAGQAQGQAWGPTAAQGFWVPQGGLDRWYAARNNAAKQRVEIVMLGDSTSQCSPGNEYSWLYQVRHDAILSGYTDGGLGMAQANIAPQSSAGVAATGSGLSLPFGGEETFAPIVSTGGTRVGFTANTGGLQVYLLPPFGYISNALNDYITLQFKGTSFRLIYSLHYNYFGAFSYSVDGGAATTTSCAIAWNANPALQKSIYVGGFTAGTHTLKITNVGVGLSTGNAVTYGGNPNNPDGPGIVNGASTLAAGTYYYGVTGVNATGESLMTKFPGSVSPSLTNAQYVSTNIWNNSGFTSYNIYRSTDNINYVKAFNIANSGASYTVWADTGATLGGTPPSTNGAGADANKTNLQLWAEFMNDTGLVWSNSACTGQTFEGYGLVDTQQVNSFPTVLMGAPPQHYQSLLTVYGTPTAGSYKLSGDNGATWTGAIAYNASAAAVQSAVQSLAYFGLAQVTSAASPGGAVNASFYITNLIDSLGGLPLIVQQITAFSPTTAAVSVSQIPGANPSKGQYRNPSLAICALGINDIGSGADLYFIANGLKNFITLARSAGADPLVVIPHYRWAGFPNTPGTNDGLYATAYETAMKATCQQQGVAWVNDNYALTAGGFGGVNGTNGLGMPHIAQNGYNIEGDYIWTQVLGANQFTLTAPAGVDWTVTAPTFSVTSPASGVTLTQNILQDNHTANVMLSNIAMTPYPNTGTLATAANKYFGPVTISDGLGHSIAVTIPAPSSAITTTGRGRRLN